MKVSLLWLKEFVDFDLDAEKTAALLRSLGFDTASVTAVGKNVAGVVTAKVESRIKHPNADKLSLCRVFDGTDRFAVVCGAPNVAEGQTVPLARVGARLPGGIEIKPAKIRGEQSQGMLCSSRELGLSEEASGIFLFPDGTPLGEDAARTLFLGDDVLDVEVMPNRPDLLSHWGVAREIAAALNKPLRLPSADLPAASGADLASIEEKSLCGRYLGKSFEGATVGPSPLWMTLRLERCGIRSISNLVDITNYVLLELGHPLHVFDRDRLAGGKVRVRLGREGEKLVCLDEVERDVAGRLIIADDARPQAIAGVMGGAPSAVTEKTRSVLLESAHFQPSHIRGTRRKFNLSTESSHRFERGTDRDMAALASLRAAKLILDLSGGKLTGGADVSGNVPEVSSPRADPARVEALLGFPVPPREVRNVLERLGFIVREEGREFVLTPPMHRADVRETADVAEEVGRLSGFDGVPVVLRAASQDRLPPTPETRLSSLGRDLLTGWGFLEAKNYGLVSKTILSSLLGTATDGLVELDNPLSLSGEFLAPSLLPGLLANLQINLRRGTSRLKLFETGRTFVGRDGAVLESGRLAFLAMGETREEHWKLKPRALELWDVKAWVTALWESWRLPAPQIVSEGLPAFLHPAQSGSFRLGDDVGGYFGRLHPRTASSLDLPADTFLAEFDLTVLARQPLRAVKHRALPVHPALLRDFSLVFPKHVRWEEISRFVLSETPLAETVDLFDVFEGKGLPEGHRSMAFRAAFRRPDRTLTDEEAAAIQDKLLAGLRTRFKADLRK